METNIIFSKQQHTKKIEAVNQMTVDDLFGTSQETIKRIIREAGCNYYRSRNKAFYIARERRAGNNWNSTIDSIDLIAGKLYVNAYLQYSNTDTTIAVPFEEFFKRCSYIGKLTASNQHGDPATYYFEYDIADKAKVIKSILLEYLYTRYKFKIEAA